MSRRSGLAIAAILVGCSTSDGKPPPKPAPVPVTRHSTLYGPAVKVSVDPSQVCAVLTSGRVACWGELGRLLERLTTTPRLVPGISDAVDVLASCARRRNGSVACWHDGSVVEIPGTQGSRQLARGQWAPCIVTAQATVACLDNDKLTSVPDLDHVQALGDVAWFARCAARTDGRVACVGNIAELGLAGDHAIVPDITDAIDVVWVAQDVGCAVRRGGALACFGRSKDVDTVGLPPKVDQLLMDAPEQGVPCVRRGGEVACREHEGDPWVPKPLGGDATDLSCVSSTCCAVVGGDIACWGDNAEGRLGDGVADGGDTPTKIAALPPIETIAAGRDVMLAIARTGDLYAWGAGTSVPVKVAGATTMLAVDTDAVIAHGRSVSIVTRERDGTWKTAPVAPSPAEIRALTLSGRDVCAALADGTTRCLHAEYSVDEPSWKTIAGMRELRQLSRVNDLMCGVTMVGAVTCRVDPTDTDHPHVVVSNVPGIANARRVSLPFVELANGNVAKLAFDGTQWTATIQLALHGFTGIESPGGSWSPTCAIVAGHVQCWNDENSSNGLGTLGRDRKLPAGTPAPTAPPLAATAVSTGANHVCALDPAGAVWCWGDDRQGELGRGRVISRTQPGRVVGIGP